MVSTPRRRSQLPPPPHHVSSPPDDNHRLLSSSVRFPRGSLEVRVRTSLTTFRTSRMAQPRYVSNPSSLRYLHLKKSFQLSIRTLLTSCSREDIDRAFPTLTHAEQEILHRSFIQVISSLHEGINAEFESFCQETQVGTILDMVEEQLEEQNLDTLFTESAKAEIDVKKKLSDVKKEEIYFLTTLLGKLQDENNTMKTRIAALKDQQPQAADVGKLKGWTLNDEDFQKPREGYF